MKEKDLSFLIISEGGDGLGLAIRLRAEGHKTSMWIRDPEAERRGEGLVEKGNSLELTPTLVADCTGSGALLDSYRNSGGLTYAGSQIQDRLESDRSFSSQIFEECGIQEPDSKEFHDWEEAKQFISSLDGSSKLVFKPEGKFSGNLPSYVSESNDDLLYMLDYFKGVVGEHEPEFVLQQFIKGTCISSEVWCAKGKIILPTNHTLERKQLMCGDIGPSGGCTGNVVWACFEEDCPLCKELLKLEGFLEECEYSGPIDVNFVVSSEGDIYALEFTPRFGYDSMPTFLYGLFNGDFGAFINDSCRGEVADLPLRNGYAAGVRLSCSPWPAEEFHAKPGLPLRGLSESGLDSFYPYEVNLQEDAFVTSGGYGIIGVAVGYSEGSIEEAFEEVYKVVRKIHLPEKQYRTDLGEVFKKDVTALRRSLGVMV
jgi:phosphoribosylamine-glycine ligase